MCGHTQVRDVWYRCWYMWAQPGGSVWYMWYMYHMDHMYTHMWYICGHTARWERGKIASISCSSTTTPASKSQLVCATIPEYDLCLQLGEAKTPEGEKTPKLGR